MTAPLTALAPAITEPLDRRVLLAGLWTSTVFVCSFTVLFGFYRADVAEGVLAGTVPGESFEIGQAFLALATAHVLLPILMIVVSLAAPPRLGRVANLVVCAVHLAPIAATVAGETWIYYLVFTVVEAALLLTIARVAWTWRAPESA